MQAGSTFQNDLRAGFLGGGAPQEEGEGDGEAGKPPPTAVPDTHIDRDLMLEVMERRAYRLKQCRSVPASVLLYIFFIVVIVLHANVPAAYEVEENLVEVLQTGYAVTSSSDWFAWMSASFLPAALYSAANALNNEGYVSTYNLMIGGIRLVTTRSNGVACSGLSSACRSNHAAGAAAQRRQAADSRDGAGLPCAHVALPPAT